MIKRSLAAFTSAKAKLFLARPLILTEGVELAGRDSVGLDRVLFRMEGAQVIEKAASNFGRRFERFAHLSRSPWSTTGAIVPSMAAAGSRYLRTFARTSNQEWV